MTMLLSWWYLLKVEFGSPQESTSEHLQNCGYACLIQSAQSWNDGLSPDVFTQSFRYFFDNHLSGYKGLCISSCYCYSWRGNRHDDWQQSEIKNSAHVQCLKNVKKEKECCQRLGNFCSCCCKLLLGRKSGPILFYFILFLVAYWGYLGGGGERLVAFLSFKMNLFWRWNL